MWLARRILEAASVSESCRGQCFTVIGPYAILRPVTADPSAGRLGHCRTTRQSCRRVSPLLEETEPASAEVFSLWRGVAEYKGSLAQTPQSRAGGIQIVL